MHVITAFLTYVRFIFIMIRLCCLQPQLVSAKLDDSFQVVVFAKMFDASGCLLRDEQL